MSNLNISNLDDFTQRLLPLTVLRRNAGEVLARLPKVGSFIVTKDGKPVAKLESLKKSEVSSKTRLKNDIEKIHRLAGGFRLGNISPRQIKKIILKRYDEMLP